MSRLTREQLDDEGVIYFGTCEIDGTALIKIGSTKKAWVGRLRSYGRQHGLVLVGKHVIKTAHFRQVEKATHARLKHEHRGYWHRATDELYHCTLAYGIQVVTEIIKAVDGQTMPVPEPAVPILDAWSYVHETQTWGEIHADWVKHGWFTDPHDPRLFIHVRPQGSTLYVPERHANLYPQPRHRFAVWCVHCKGWHSHSPHEGHRNAHCGDPMPPSDPDPNWTPWKRPIHYWVPPPPSPYRLTGYHLVHVGAAPTKLTYAIRKRTISPDEVKIGATYIAQ